MSLRLPIIILVLVFFNLDLISEKKNIKDIHLKKVLSIGQIDDAWLYQWAGVAADDEGNVYLTDLMDYSIKKFSKEGRFLKKHGEKGQGPGEFNSPALIKHHNNRLYISEIYKTGIQVFSEDIEFISTIPIPHPIHGFKIISPDEIAVTGPTLSVPDTSSYLIIYNSIGKEIKRIRYGPSEKIPMLDMIDFDIDRDKNIYIIYTWLDKVKKLNQDGKLIFEKSILGIKKPFLREGNSPLGELPEKVCFKGISLDVYGNIFILGGHLSKNPSRDIYVLDHTGHLISTKTLEEPSHTIYIDKTNFLYTSADQGITLYKYRLEYVYD